MLRLIEEKKIDRSKKEIEYDTFIIRLGETKCLICLDVGTITLPITTNMGVYSYGFACACVNDINRKQLKVPPDINSIHYAVGKGEFKLACNIGGELGQWCPLKVKKDKCKKFRCPKFDMEKK